MQSFRVLSCYLNNSRFLFFDRTLCSLSNGNVQHLRDAEDLVLVEKQASSRTVILNRPLALNALTTSTGTRLRKLYESWERDPDVGFVVLKVAIVGGITMGGGAGISVHGSYRIATDTTVFSTPEVLIGLHPDAGASYYLSRLPSYFEEYLALTGDSTGGEEMLAWGLATNYASSASLPLIEEGLSNLMTHDFSVMETFLEKYGGPNILMRENILQRVEKVNICFSHGTIEEIMTALETEEARSKDKWCSSAIKKLREAPPLMLKIREGRIQSLEQCLAREYMMTLQVIFGKISSDFCEGIRARLLDKCFAPKWNPSCLESVTEDMVNAYFESSDDCEPELHFPAKSRKEAFAF